MLKRGLSFIPLLLLACPPTLDAEAPTPPAASPGAQKASFQFGPQEPATVEPPKTEAPLSLTASDGTGLRLVQLNARGVVEGPLAFTEMKLRFENPEPRVREGRFRVVLPDGASISRFAMKIGSRWQEGEVVERQRARRVYEDFLHRRQDPALLEQAAGNEFTARVFPIPAKAEKELIVSFSHNLRRSDEPYRIPLRGLPQLDALDIEVQVAKSSAGPAKSSLQGTLLRREVVRVDKKNWVPDADFEVEVPASLGAGVRHENLVLARVSPPVAEGSDPISGLTVLVDTSASRALGFDAQIRLVEKLANGLAEGTGKDTPFRVVAFDQETVELYEGTAGGVGTKARSGLEARKALGATDIAQALNWLSENTKKGRYDRLLVVSDGVSTLGEVDGEVLKKAGFTRVDAVAVGGLRDGESLKRLTTAGLPKDGVVLDGALSLQEIGRRLGQSTLSGVKVEVEGAQWVWPQELDGVQTGDEVLIFADLPPKKNFRLKLNGQAVQLGKLADVPRPLLERAWVGARMARLLDRRTRLDPSDRDVRAALKKQVIELSTNHRVLSPYTALLVLETPWDYRRYGIQQDALADILTVGANGVTVLAERTLAERFQTSSPRTTRGGVRKRARIRLQEVRIEGREPAPAAPSADLPEAEERLGRGSNNAVAGLRGPARRHAGGVNDLETRGFGGRDLDADSYREAAPAAAEASAVERPPPAPVPARREARSRRPMARRSRRADRAMTQQEAVERKSTPAVSGTLAEVRALMGRDELSKALEAAEAWRARSPGDVLALVALGEALEKKDDLSNAARAFGSIVDLFPARADMLRFAANRLEALKRKAELQLAVRVYEKAVAQRPDHPSGHRGLAFARLRLGEPEAAFEALKAGLGQRYPDRFPGVIRILSEDLGLVAAVWKARSPNQEKEIDARLKEAKGEAAQGVSLRFVLTWETDANDVDFHIHDAKDGHAFYKQKSLESGGELYADVTRGYGPECFTVEGPPKGFPYRLEAHYYRKGPMGYGMGRVQIIKHDGEGKLQFDDRPFVVMNDGAFVPLGTVEASLFD